MIQPKNPPLISGTQFVAIVVVTIAIFLVVDFGRRATAGYYVSQAEKSLKAQIAAELTRQAELKAQKQYVKSDEYVEKWAREQAHMIRPGDRALILVTPEAPLRSVTSPELAISSSPTQNWHGWWRLFFDTEPGTLRMD